MTTAIIVQARMNSARFPGKMLAPLAGKPVIEHVLDRALEVDGVDRVVLATSHEKCDVPLANYVRETYRDDVLVFRGLAGNVLHRFYRAAVAAGRPDVVVRLTGDCPLIDPRWVEQRLRDAIGVAYLDYTNAPDGGDVEVMTFAALSEAYRNAGPDEVEHVTTWLRRNRPGRVVSETPETHYSIDTVADLRFCDELLTVCGEGARTEDFVDAIRRQRDQGGF